MPGTVIYDADCGFCTTCATWLQAHGTCEIAPWQSLDLDAIGLTEADVSAAAWWIDPTGVVLERGAGAVGEALKTCRGPYAVLGRLTLARPIRPLANLVYRLVARYRYRLPGGTAACKIN